MKILIIEDDLSLAENISMVLKKNGFAADIVHTSGDGQMNSEINEYDCMILDIGLPDGNGFEFLENLRKNSNDTPVIIMTARGETDDRIKGLNLGADDYVPKPVDSLELIARIRAIIRRNSQKSLPVLTAGSLTLKPAEQTAIIGDHQLELTAKEFSVLEYLMHHSNQIITRTMLMEHIWGSDFETFSNVIDVYIRNLRRKLEKYSRSDYIKTIRGKGYILENHDN